jgi:NAD-dependent SIR2 family protein deacetylase
MKNEIYCPHCHHAFAQDYSQMIKQSCSKAVSVQTRCPHCNQPLYYIVTKTNITYFKTHEELLGMYELLFGKS